MLGRWFEKKQDGGSPAPAAGLKGPRVPRHSGGWSEVRKRLEMFRKQAQLLVKGNQDSNADVPYLVDSLREAAGMKRTWGTSGSPEDEERLRLEGG